MQKIRLGAVNWDASIATNTYFGFYQTNSLSQEKYREWTPFYADIIDKEKISYHNRSVEEYEKEMLYAIEAGLDYFAFVWYPTEGSLSHTPRNQFDCSHKVHELNYARRLYEKSSLKDKLNMCAILGAHPFTDADLFELIDAFSKPYYEKVDSRPLLYVYGCDEYRTEIIEKIHKMCAERGVPSPYTVPMMEEVPKETPLADALSAYAVTTRGISTHDELVDDAIERITLRLSYKQKLIPTFTVGWNPAPRIDRPTPWTSISDGVSAYPNVGYASRATVDELYRGAEKFASFIKNEAYDSFMGHILTFSWNEFEEGGYFCPTYTQNAEINTERVEIFAKIAALFREELKGI